MHRPIRARDFVSVTLLAGVLGVSAIAVPIAGRQGDKAADSADLIATKMLAVATLVYSADADDDLPLATSEVNGTRMAVADFPLGWRKGSSDSLTGHWATAIMPYTKATKYYASPQAPLVDEGGEASDGKAPFEATFAYNGLLTQFGQSGIARPESVTLFSEAFGFVRTRGVAASSPVLDCAPGGVCRYGAGLGARLLASDRPFLPPSRRSPVAFADGSARLIEWKGDETTGPKALAWAELDSAGKPKSAWHDASGRFPLAFRPDYDPQKDDASARIVLR